MTYAPIAMFVYKRPMHTQRTIWSLKRCPEFSESPLYVFCDGPRKPLEDSEVQQVRLAARGALSGHAKFIESKENKGLAFSIIEGVTRICKEFGRVIVVEDDLVVSPKFLAFLNLALDRYEHQARVMQISGHMFPVPAFEGRSKAMFLPFTTSWGWATWDRAWRDFDPDVNGWERLTTDTDFRRRFNVGNAFDYYDMLKLQLSGKIDSWAIRWYWSVFCRNGLILYPPISLVSNEGFDGSGTHGWRSASRLLKQIIERNTRIPALPDKVEVSEDELAHVRLSLQTMRGGVGKRTLKVIKSALSKLKTGFISR